MPSGSLLEREPPADVGRPVRHVEAVPAEERQRHSLQTEAEARSVGQLAVAVRISKSRPKWSWW